MIIVSQDKKTIVNFDKVKSIWIDDNVLDKTNTEFEICAGGETLGHYKTEGRAIEVLVEIATAYTNMEIINIPTIYVHEEITAQRMAKNICFEMPKE